MLDDKPNSNGKEALSTGGILVRLAAIGGALALIAATFLYVGGWTARDRLTQDGLMAAFRVVNGDHPGFRLNHSKGVCVDGWFDSSGQATALSKAAVFELGRVPVVGRFSLAGGMPFQIDRPATVRAMALRFLPAGAEEWRTGMLNLPVFPVNSARGFHDQLLASAADPATGKPNPSRMKTFLDSHPETVKALALIAKRNISAGFSDSTYNSLNAFRFINAAGSSVPVRWSLVPPEPVLTDLSAQAASEDKNYLFDALIAKIRQHPLQWKLMIVVGEPGDPTNDATLPWPKDLRQVDAGTVTIDQVSSESTGACTNINFDPLVLPYGIEATDDPLLSARSSVYAASFTLRAAQHREKLPSAIIQDNVRGAGK
jgi:catalase